MFQDWSEERPKRSRPCKEVTVFISARDERDGIENGKRQIKRNILNSNVTELHHSDQRGKINITLVLNRKFEAMVMSPTQNCDGYLEYNTRLCVAVQNKYQVNLTKQKSPATVEP